MTADPQFALNHMCAPALGVIPFLDLAAGLGITSVELRNDLPGQADITAADATAVGREAKRRGLRIISINALQRFNEWTPEREAEARELIATCVACGAEALVLVPVNDGSGRGDGERKANLRQALEGLAPLLGQDGIKGLVEPLGFGICSLSRKPEAADVIRALGKANTFAMVHDTFHHHLAGDPAIFPDLTGLVHISGVTDPVVSVPDMRDSHRVLVDADDRLDNIGQLRRLIAAGYQGPLSFEPFAESVHQLDDIGGALRRSMDFIRAGLGEAVA